MPKYIGETNEKFTNGDVYNVEVQDMSGRVYADMNDREGQPDNRVMAFAGGYGWSYYQVFTTPEDVLKTWEFSQKPSAPRVRSAWDRAEIAKMTAKK